MKMLLFTLASLTLSFAAQASVIVGIDYGNAQSNCTIASGGSGQISNCSQNPNGTLTCDCQANQSVNQSGSGLQCSAIVGVNYGSAQSNCTTASLGSGQISNCSQNPNGTVTCSCCY